MRLRSLLRRWPLLLWLVLLWIVLWGTPTPTVVVGGVLAVALVAALFPLPPLRERVALRPWGVVALVWHVLVDLVASSLTVAWEVVRYGPRSRAAVVSVRLSVDTDLLIAVIANLTSLSPGAIAVEIDRGERVLYVHTLPVRTDAEVDRKRQDVLDIERWVVRALGPPRHRRTYAEGQEERP